MQSDRNPNDSPAQPPADNLTRGVGRSANGASIEANSSKAVSLSSQVGIYFAWAGFQRRQVSMAIYCGFEIIFLPTRRPANWLRKGFSYLHNAWLTLAILRKRQPITIWMQLPQVPLMWIALFYRLFTRRKVTLIADCHNAMFRPPWSHVPLGVGLLSQCDIVLTHTNEMKNQAASLGVNADRLMVVGDPPALIAPGSNHVKTLNCARPWIVFPASYAEDEPIIEILDAARLIPSVSILFTGDSSRLLRRGVKINIPENVSFLGYVPRTEFESLLVESDAIIAFTKLEGLQLSVCGEALGAGKPLLMSDTQTLRRLFPIGAVFVNSSEPKSIADGLKRLLAQKGDLARQINELRVLRHKEWEQEVVTRLFQRIESIQANQ